LTSNLEEKPEGEEEGEEDDDDENGQKQTFKFARNEQGYAILPQYHSFKRRALMNLIREYTTLNYRKFFKSCNANLNLYLILEGTFTGNPEAKVNWTAMGRSPDQYFAADSVPPDFVWEDPSHMLINTIHGLLGHWYERQDEGKIGMEFIGCPPNDFVKNDHRQKLKANKDKTGEEEDPSLVPELPASCPPADILHNKAPFSMFRKTAHDKIIYLRSLCGDSNYQKMVDALAASDKVFRC
jgi:hypothetical protein